MTETTSYPARCHCGAVRFRFRSAPITAGVRCNCSICIRKGTIMSVAYIQPEDFEELIGLEALSVYRWGNQTVNHYFCRTCGIAPFHNSPLKPGRRVNLGCVEGIDPFALKIDLIDGKSF